MKIAVIGQGYVGAPLAAAALSAGHLVIGIDNDPSKAASSPFVVTSDYAQIADSEIVIFCLPTPLDSSGNPNNTVLLAGVTQAVAHIAPGTLVINESTVAPGFNREVLLPLFSFLPSVDVAYSPERIDPASQSWNVTNTPKLVAGFTPQATDRAVEFYSSFVSQVHVGSVEVVETAKLLENSFRLVNISFINEIAIFCEKMKIDVREVVAAASTKPFGYMPFYPSAGVGGHCIPVDPSYLVEKARSIGAPTQFIDLANNVNRSMPTYFAGVVAGKLDGLSGKKIIVIGIAYKPDVADIRESPALPLIELLRAGGAHVVWHDDLVCSWGGEESTGLSRDFDLAILVNPHSGTDLSLLGPVDLLNTRGGY